MGKILVVDDAKLMRKMIKNIVAEMEDYLVLEAENGEAAIELYKVTKPDIVTMDVTMDLKNGADAAKEILEMDPKARIIMITALGQEELLKDCIAAGVKDFIVKPFQKDRVLTAIKKALES